MIAYTYGNHVYINLTVLCWEVDGLYPTIEMAGISPYLLLKDGDVVKPTKVIEVIHN